MLLELVHICILSAKRIEIAPPNARINITGQMKTISSIKVGTGIASDCYVGSVMTSAQLFSVKIDTTRGDLILAASGVNMFAGPTVDVFSSVSPLVEKLPDGSFWQGFLTRQPLDITGVGISPNAPIVLITAQNNPTSTVDSFLGKGPTCIMFRCKWGTRILLSATIKFLWRSTAKCDRIAGSVGHK